jgi:hypothetical protein
LVVAVPSRISKSEPYTTGEEATPYHFAFLYFENSNFKKRELVVGEQ